MQAPDDDNIIANGNWPLRGSRPASMKVSM